jgi:hypothetical protein
MFAIRMVRGLLVAAAMFGTLGSIGCQVEMAGLTLPSARYLDDDVQYFAPGPDFPLANEEAALAENVVPVAP